MKSQEIREQFQNFFTEFAHTKVESSALVPANDPTLYFTNAGMVQFKDVFTGAEARDYSRAVSVQKCLRVSGKHNDLENVGRTPRHHTFFEMLGNFSFGDYFKAEAIDFAWRFLTVVCGVDAQRLWVTVFEDDDEAYELWSKVDGLDPARIQRLGAKDNFWSMGDTGPCGPCAEIHYDHGPEHGPSGGPATESPRYVEIWNLVFMQFDRSADGTLTPLPRPSIDTGMGLERIAAVLQGVYSNYDTDGFKSLLGFISDLAGVEQGADPEHDVAMRVIADHARATTHLIADGVMPSNVERGYVLRRVMRRAIRFGVKLGMQGAFLHKVCEQVIGQMSAAYPALNERKSFVLEVVKAEEDRFATTLHDGLRLLEREIATLEEGGHTVLPGKVIFTLYDTNGFPPDLTEQILEEHGLTGDIAGYQKLMAIKKDHDRDGWKGSGEQSVGNLWHTLAGEGVATTFSGYDKDTDQSEILAILKDGQRAAHLAAGDTAVLVVARTPFYGESGGQVGDRGTIAGATGQAQVTDTQKPHPDLVAHHVTLNAGQLQVGEKVHLQVDTGRRDQVRLNHTATHLLHAALREVLGDHVLQKGSLVDADRLRFDFAHHKQVSAEELADIEARVYGQILRNTAVDSSVKSMDAAKAQGAMALFGEKYGDEVRVIEVPGFSVELCGGTHARRTGDIGLFRIVSESGVAAGVRRIEALTGPGAYTWATDRDRALQAAAAHLRTNPDDVADAVARIMDDRRRLERELDTMRRELARAQAGDIMDSVREIDGIKVLAAELSGDASTLRDEADRLRDKLGSGVVVLAARDEGSVKLVVTVSKDLAGKRLHAGKLIKEIAGVVGGGGGGRPDMAQAGGRNPDKLPEALETVYRLVSGG